MPEIALEHGTVRYRDEGSGPPIVFIHGALVNGTLWAPVVERLAGRARCIVPDLPLGSHSVPVRPGADLSPFGLARLIAGLLDALDLRDVTLVGNDTGGALCQLVAVRHPERLARLVLTDCDAFGNFPPKVFRSLVVAARAHLLGAVLQTMRLRTLRRLPLAYGWLTEHRMPDAVIDGWVRPFLADGAVRRDTRRFLAAVDPTLLLDNTPRLMEFSRPVLIVWAREDRFFPIAHAHRLAAIFPNARVVEVDDARTFVSLDQPELVASSIADFSAGRTA